MGSLSYTVAMSLDGYIADADGDFDWAAPSQELFRWHIDRLASASTEIIGRNTFLLMKYWEQEQDDESWGPDERQFAELWQGFHQTVVSSTLTAADVTSPNTDLVPELSLADLRRIVDEATGEVEIFGPTTAAEAIKAGMVRDFRFLIYPKIVGGGLRAMPPGADLDLEFAGQRAFDSGIVLMHYRAT